MDLKEKILDDSHWNFINEIGTSSINTKTFPSAYKEQALEAMDELSKIVAIAFGKFISTHRLDFQPASPDGYWIGLDMKKYSTEDLFQLFTQSKEYQELMDAK